MPLGGERLAKLADIILITLALLCVCVLCYFVYHYAWKEEREFGSWLGILMYYALPAAAAAGLFASLRLRPAHRMNLALLLCSAGSSLFALEACLTIWSSLPSVKEAQNRNLRAATARPLGIQFDTRSKLQVVLDLRSRGIDAVPSFDRPLLESRNDGSRRALLSAGGRPILPFGSAAGKKVVLCNEFGTFVTYRSDRHGFNNPEGIWERPSVEIMAVGDSFVQGWCVPVDRSFMALIRHRYPWTLNLGMEGNGPLVMLAAMKEYGPIVKPKTVLWFFFEGNDLVDLQKELNSPLLRKYLDSEFTQRLYTRQAEIDRVLTDYLDSVKGRSSVSIKMQEIKTELSLLLAEPRRLRNRLNRALRFAELRDRLGMVYGSKADGREPPESEAPGTSEEVMDYFGRILSEAKRTAGQWGGEVHFVYLPSATRYARAGSVPDSDRERVLGRAAVAGMPVIDIVQAFARVEDPMSLFPFGGFGHYTEEGHFVVAEEVLERIAMRQ